VDVAIPSKISPLKALGLLVAAIVMVALYIILFGALGNLEFYAGFLFLACWTLIDHGKMTRLPHAICGSALGLALGYAMHVLMAGPLGANGGHVFGAIVLVVLYCQIIGWLPLFINATTMMFLAVVTIPHIQAYGDFAKTAIALGIGIVYFGVILGIASWISAKPSAP
jgi:hypothetical protein